jgi:hypothetical protein
MPGDQKETTMLELLKLLTSRGAIGAVEAETSSDTTPLQLPIHSTALAAASYRKQDGELEVTFVAKGGTYKYQNVLSTAVPNNTRFIVHTRGAALGFGGGSRSETSFDVRGFFEGLPNHTQFPNDRNGHEPDCAEGLLVHSNAKPTQGGD